MRVYASRVNQTVSKQTRFSRPKYGIKCAIHFHEKGEREREKPRLIEISNIPLLFVGEKKNTFSQEAMKWKLYNSLKRVDENKQVDDTHLTELQSSWHRCANGGDSWKLSVREKVMSHKSLNENYLNPHAVRRLRTSVLAGRWTAYTLMAMTYVWGKPDKENYGNCKVSVISRYEASIRRGTWS